jgi:acetyl esterase/lipase
MPRANLAIAGAAVLCAVLPLPLQAEKRVEKNVIYGMYSGLALLMDIHHPEQPNGYGIVHISGSGWSAPLGLDARPLKESGHVKIEALPLVDAGYTIFTLNHRASTRFHYPAPVEDVQRAVRFVRHHASRYGIDPEAIGAIGGSSGGHLVSMLGVLDGAGDPDDESEINRVSAKVQCVVARATPANLTAMREGAVSLMLGARIRDNLSPGSAEMRLAREASPVTHVTGDDPPFLLIHGDADDVVPLKQSEELRDALRKAGVAVELVRVKGAGHGPGMPGALAPPDIGGRAAKWFDLHLRRK